MKAITTVALASVVVIAIVVAALPATGVWPGNGGVAGSTEGRPSLALCEDLNEGSGLFAAGQPVFVELNGSDEGASQGNTALRVEGANASNVRVQTFGAGGLSPPWDPIEDESGVQGALPGAAGAGSPDRSVIVLVFDRPGNYSVEALPDGASASTPEAIDIEVVGTAGLFEAPHLDERAAAAWLDPVATNEELNFTVSANTTDLWKTEEWTTFYNWTVSVINLRGMEVGGDLSEYNTGALGLDPGVLDRTTVLSSWDSGYNSAFYTVWNGTGGTRLTGDAAMTPTGKEITYGGTAWHAWTTGAWQPSGTGRLTFHEAGVYLLVITLTKNGEAVGPALMQPVTAR